MFQALKKPTVALSEKYWHQASTPHFLPENNSLQSKVFFRGGIQPATAIVFSGNSSIVDKEYPNQSFNVTIDLLGKHGDTVIVGDTVGYSMYSEKDAFLLLINVTPTGIVHVIYPYEQHELVKIGANQTIRLENLGIVEGPPGKEVLKLIAFQEKPVGFDQFLGAEDIRPGSSQYQRLEKMLGMRGKEITQISNSRGIAQHTISVDSVAL